MRVLPAGVYDTLELSALAYGGIGAGNWKDRDRQPLCAIGHLWFLEGDGPFSSPIADAFVAEGISVEASNAAVRAINKSLGRPRDDRIPFAEWCKGMNIVRGA